MTTPNENMSNKSEETKTTPIGKGLGVACCSVLKCETCLHHNGSHWNNGMSEKWCDIHKAATDIRDGCAKHSECQR